MADWFPVFMSLLSGAEACLMGGVVPDRFFWALPPADEGEAPPEGAPLPDPDTPDTKGKPAPRRVH